MYRFRVYTVQGLGSIPSNFNYFRNKINLDFNDIFTKCVSFFWAKYTSKTLLVGNTLNKR